MRGATFIAALVAAGAAIAQGEAPKPAGSPPARPPVDIPPPPCSSSPELVKLDSLLIQWNQAYQPLQAGISLEVAASNTEGLAQGDEARAKDAVSTLRASVLDLQTEVGVRERQIRTVEDTLKPGSAPDRLNDKDYLADRQKLIAALQTMLAKVKEQYAKAQADLSKAETGLQAAEDRLKAADQGFGDAARDSFQAMQADKSAEDAFESELLSQRSRTCAQSRVAAAAAPNPVTANPPAPGPPPQSVAQETPPPAPIQQPASVPPESSAPAAPASDVALQPSAESKSAAETQQAVPSQTAPTPPPEATPAPIPTQPAPPPEPGAESAEQAKTAPAGRIETSTLTACSASKMEADVLATMNKARTAPTQFYNVLEQDFGRGSYRDARTFLKGLKPVPGLACDGRLEAAAHKHLADQGPLGGESHAGSDGSQPWQRIQAAGVTAQVYAEEISVSFPTALGVVSELIIDPQAPPPNAGPKPPPLVHPTRLDVLNPDLAVAGVACGSNTKFKVMCVIDLSSRPQTSGS